MAVCVRGHFATAGRWALCIGGYASILCVTGLVIARAVETVATVWLQAPSARVIARPAAAPPAETRVVRVAVMVPTQDEWADKLRDPAFWAKNRAGSKPASWTKPSVETPRLNLGAPVPSTALNPGLNPGTRRSVVKPSVQEEAGDETFRTMCVRSCDGAFFPLSFSTERDNFDADAARCEKQCPGARLFYYRNPGAELEDMEDLKGVAYKKLPTAFLFRTTYDAQCKCRPHPWEEAARTQHRLYALEAQRAKGSKTAAAELNDLKVRLKQAELDAVADKKRADADKVAAQKKQAEAAKAAKVSARAAGATGGPTEIKASAAGASADAASTVNVWGPKPKPMTVAVQSQTQTARTATPLSSAATGEGRSMRLGGPQSKPQTR